MIQPVCIQANASIGFPLINQEAQSNPKEIDTPLYKTLGQKPKVFRLMLFDNFITYDDLKMECKLWKSTTLIANEMVPKKDLLRLQCIPPHGRLN